MELIENKALKITVPHDMVPAIQEHIAKVTVAEVRQQVTALVVYWGIDEMITLNKLCTFAQPLPSPITRDYKWSGRFQPFEHQKVTSEFLSTQTRAFCFNEAGTGKTSSVL